jgi:hypothetical protein
MAVYGKVSGSQARGIAAKALGVQDSSQAAEPATEAKSESEAKSEAKGGVAQEVLEGFEQTRQHDN